jgi:photosystem II stability/assembly factor-like uncharacterized protein
MKIILKNTCTVFLLSVTTIILITTATYPQGAANFNSIKCQSEQQAMMVGDDGAIAKSKDGGMSWQSGSCGITNRLSSLLIIDKTTILAVAENGVILKTEDAGATWKYICTTFDNLNDITKFSGFQRIFACGENGKMLISDDIGNTWSNVTTGTTANLRHIHFANDTVGYAVGDNGTLIKSIDGGVSWYLIDLSDFGKHNFNSIGVIDRNHFTIVGSESLVIYSADGGVSFSRSSLPYLPILNMFDIVFLNSREGVIVGGSGLILKSIDRGESWVFSTIIKTKSSSKYADFISVSFYSPKCGIAIGQPEMDYITSDGGNTWTGASTGCNVIKTKDYVSVESFALKQNFPNPFNPSTIISYNLPFDASVTLKVYDMLGKQITSLVNANQSAGSYNFKFDGANLSSGIYFYTLIANGTNINFSKTMRMILTK